MAELPRNPRSLPVRLWLPIDRGLRRVLLAAVRGYRKLLSPLLGDVCRFVPSCSNYAEEVLVRGPLLPGLWLIVWRLARCQPLCKGGMDPVPETFGGGDWMLKVDGCGCGGDQN